MNILLFHPISNTVNLEALNKVVFCLEANSNLEILMATEFEQALDHFLGETPIDAVITATSVESDKLFKYMLSLSTSLPLILIQPEPLGTLELYPELNVVGQVKNLEQPEALSQLINELIKEKLAAVGQSPEDAEFCRIKTDLLVRVIPLKGDVYIRLSSVKFVKLFKNGTVFTPTDLEKFLIKKKVGHLYIRKNESQEFVEKFKADLKQTLMKSSVGDESLLGTVVDVQELVHTLINRLGFTQEVRELAQTNIELAVKSIGASPKLSKVLSSAQFTSKNYISSHSVVLAHLACSIAAQMQWPSNTTFQKLVMASLFHDLLIQDPELAKVSTKKELEALKLKPSDETYLAIKNHPLKAAELVKSFSEIPGDVEVLVLQHHERADGSGFPKGIRAHQIAPLSALLIISHDILDAIERQNEKFELKVFLRRMEPEYQGNVFRKVWKALLAVEEASGTTAA